MKCAVFSTKSYDEQFLDSTNREESFGHELTFFETRLEEQTLRLAEGHEAVCVFVNDQLTRSVVAGLAESGIKVIALRCAGFNNVDLEAASDHGIKVVRVPAYSPHAVAEHALGLVLCLNRRIHRAYQRVREGNFALDGLLGFDLHGKTFGVVGTGKIGTIFAQLLSSFGVSLLGYDPYPNRDLEQIGLRFVELDELLAGSDVISLHCPLTPETDHLIDAAALGKMKQGAMLINTSRGRLIDTHAVIEALKSGQLGNLALDVYEEEADLFFEDLSNKVIQDDVFSRLLTFPNVVVTGHQAFFTEEALRAIAETTLGNLAEIEQSGQCANTVEAGPGGKG